MGQSESGIEINCERERQISQKHILFSSSPKANSTKCKTLSLCHTFPSLSLSLFHFIFQLHFPISPHFHFHFHFIFQQLLNHSDFLAWLIICVCHRSQRQRSFFSPSFSLSLFLSISKAEGSAPSQVCSSPARTLLGYGLEENLIKNVLAAAASINPKIKAYK